MTTPINGQNYEGFKSIPNQVHTVFGWGLNIIDLRVYLKICYFHIESFKSRMEEYCRTQQFPSKVKVINIKVKVIMDLEGAFLDLEGALCIVCQTVGAMAALASRFLRPWIKIFTTEKLLRNFVLSSTGSLDLFDLLYVGTLKNV